MATKIAIDGWGMDFGGTIGGMTVHEKCTSSRMHVKIFTTCQGYSSIETRALAVFASNCIAPRVVQMSRYLDREKHIGAYVCIYT